MCFAARSLVIVAVSAALGGCIVADPPLYESPPLSAPILDLVQGQPPIGKVIPVDRDDDPAADERTSIVFSIPLILSEDDGDRIRYALHVDYLFVPYWRSRTTIHSELPPRSIEDRERVITFTWPVPAGVSDGCHQLTLLVGHERFWLAQESRPDTVRGLGDTVAATWWINVNPRPGERYTLRDCPDGGEVQQ